MRLTLVVLALFALALVATPAIGSHSTAHATVACPPNPSPPDPADPSMVLDQPVEGASVTSPVTISGKARVFEANVSIEIYNASGTLIVETFTTAAEAGPVLAPFSASVPFSVPAEQAGCIRVFESSAQDGSPRNVVQVEVTLSPPTTPPKTGSAGLQDDPSDDRGPLWPYVVGGLALLGATALAAKRSLWD